ncbi:hypothetical protein [Nocardia sp. NPDC004260]
MNSISVIGNCGDDDASQQKFGGGADDLAASEPWFIAELDTDRPRRFRLDESKCFVR